MPKDAHTSRKYVLPNNVHVGDVLDFHFALGQLPEGLEGLACMQVSVSSCNLFAQSSTMPVVPESCSSKLNNTWPSFKSSNMFPICGAVFASSGLPRINGGTATHLDRRIMPFQLHVDPISKYLLLSILMIQIRSMVCLGHSAGHVGIFLHRSDLLSG